MGPRFCKRGNMMMTATPSKSKSPLQWGHAFVSVETTPEQVQASIEASLQWGHAFVSVETTLSQAPSGALYGSFNGATLL